MFERLGPLTEEEVASHVEAIARDGYSILRDAVNTDERERIQRELDRLELARPGGDFPKGPFIGHVTRRWVDLLNDGEVWQWTGIHPWVLQVLEPVLGDGFLLSSLSTIVIGPGEPAQGIHVDDAIYGFERPHPILSCNALWALSDFTAANGATRIVPGSHAWPDDPAAGGEYESIPAEMPAGSILLVHGSCYHGGGANATNHDRPAIAMNYCRGVVRQQENIMLAVHPARMMTFPRALQDIIGFRQGAMTGYIFGQDPRVELERHYPVPDPEDPYLARRDAFHAERISVVDPYV